jgi:hypothetical protein
MDEIENPTQESTTSLESLGKKETKGAKERETWSGKFDFFLSALGYAGKRIIHQYKTFNTILI